MEPLKCYLTQILVKHSVFGLNGQLVNVQPPAGLDNEQKPEQNSLMSLLKAHAQALHQLPKNATLLNAKVKKS